MTTVLLTGAGGFVGSHVLRHLLVNTDWKIICPVTFRHKGSSDRIASSLGDLPHVVDRNLKGRVQIVHHDLTMPFSQQWIERIGKIDVIMNVASESHVDRSIGDPVGFIQNNVNLILNLLEYARVVRPKLFLQMSTDEVYGPAVAPHLHSEGEPHRPSNPYSASKAAQESIIYSYWRTYAVPVIITNTMNIFGEMQDPEKYFAKIMRCVMRGEPVPVHGKPMLTVRGRDNEYAVHEWQAGSRFYLHARNLADAWLFLTKRSLDPNDSMSKVNTWSPFVTDIPRFNVVGEKEIDNKELAQMIASVMRKGFTVDWVDFHSSRPGHDLRYALNGMKLAEYGWHAPVSLEEGIERTVEWTLRHSEWL